MTGLVLEFPAPKAQSTNDLNGAHHGAIRRHRQPWKTNAWAHAHNAKVTRTSRGRPWVPEPVTVQVTIPFRVARTRDPHNYTGTVVKAVVDGLVQAGIVPDDNAEWVTVLDPILTVVPAPSPLTCRVAIRPRPEENP